MRTSGARPHIVVVGGGISGLAAALAVLDRSAGEMDVTVLEGAAVLGGKLALTEVAGIPVDAGAESMLARRPEGLALVHAAGLGDDVVHPAAAGASVWSRGAMRPLPSGQLMGIPGDLRSLAASGVISLPGLARIPLDHVLARTPVRGDVSLGSFVAGRLGREVVDRLVEPLLGGVYAGHADELSLDATLPQLSGAVRVERSLLRAVEQVLGSGSAGAAVGVAGAGIAGPTAEPPGLARPVFAGISGGVGRLPGAVAAACERAGATVRVGAMVRELRRSPGGWRVVLGPARQPEQIFADAVVLAVPAPAASRLLQGVAPDAAADLGTIEYAGVGLVTFAVPLDQVADRLSGTGFLVPPVDGRVVKAATYSSQKWQWLADSAGDLAVLRVSVGRHREVGDLQRDDDELAALALADLSAALRTDLRPVGRRVTRWGGALPQYSVGHPDRVARIRRAIAEHPGLAVCGAAYDGVGIPACAGSARTAADRVLVSLAARRQWGHG
jgi:protoporphyrinogen/coproporphyrinogen III oxidase